MKNSVRFLLFLFLVSCGVGSQSDKLSFSTKTLSKEGCVDEDCAKIDFSWPHIMSNPDSAEINGLIEKRLANYILPQDSTFKDDFGAQDFVDEFKEIKEELPDMPGRWFINAKSEITFDSLGLLSIQFYQENYMGGAHGNYSWEFLNYDLEIGQELNNEDLILDEEALLKIAEKEFRSFHEVEEGADLNATGFFNIPESGFFLPRAMGYSGGNFKLVYNSYEIGPYALGPTELEIDLAELKGIVRMD